MSLPRLYGELAEWWHLMSPPSNYSEEAGIFIAIFEGHSSGPIRTMLELGSGGGNNASYMKERYEMTLTDISAQMLEQSRRLNPECEHVQGDMRTLRLNRTFDAVFVHDAIAYMTTEDDLGAAMRTAYLHLASPGMALFVPDDIAETIRRSVFQGGGEKNDRSLRYFYQQEIPEPGATTYETTMTYVIREGGTQRMEVDKHTFGVFPRATWLGLLAGVGFEPKPLPYRHSSFAPDAGKELFVGLKP